jgi:cytochrome c oxidase assembly protein subunit 15
MAGLKAALLAPTWPTINGAWLVPLDGLPWNEPLLVHFIHRGLAYVLLGALGWWWWRAKGKLSLERHLVLALVALQVVLGVLTVLNAPFAGRLLWFGFAHQAVGTLLFAALVWARRTLEEAR